ncbi:peptide deformylase [Romboutsia sedimentorum]|uniref:Peptide deformylase n=1 Tax=Romboutsia sedimentorum TaxID=1368474 RepID=A0ABT7E861_9FIRM|nr:peptide deformylase [Romboutsia sedimentorum]MDK2563120.1 peptide deformylase [Romboutsia sedimentorum]
MALREVVQIGEPVLRKKSKKVEKVDEKIIQLLEDMADTMYHFDGVGLAAPQVGILKRIAVIDIGDGIIELINPEIIQTSGEQIDDEGCLSVVGEAGEVKRPYKVKVRAFNRKGQLFEIEGEELLARAFCHEIDHLDGVLFVDKIQK